MQRIRIRSAVLIACLLLLATASHARAEIAWPKADLPADTSIMLWLNLESMDVDKLEESAEFLTQLMPAAAADDGQDPEQQTAEKMKAFREFRQSLLDAGVQSYVMAHRTPAAGAQAGAQASQGENEIAFFKISADFDKAELRKAFESDAALSIMQNANKPQAQIEQDRKRWLDQLDNLKVINDDWAMVPSTREVERTLTEEQLDTFKSSVADVADSAPFLVAFRLTDASRAQMDMMTQTQPMIASLVVPLKGMQWGRAVVEAGEKPSLNFTLNFTDDATAGQFRNALIGMSQLATQMVQMMAMQAQQQAQMNGQVQQADPQAINKTMQLVTQMLTMKQQGTQLHTTIGSELLTSLGDMGVEFNPGNQAQPGMAQ